MINIQNINDHLPGYLAIGEDGGGMLAFIKLDSLDSSVYCTWASFVDEQDLEKMADSISDWVKSKCPFSEGYFD